MVKAGNADPRVGHAVEDVLDPVDLLDRGREDDVGHESKPLVLGLRFQQGFRRPGSMAPAA